MIIDPMSPMKNTKVIVTGAAGYIGGQICIELKKKNYYVIGIDRRYKPHLNKFYDEFYQVDFASDISYNMLHRHKPAAIIHCAGTSLVGPSLERPAEYFNNNVGKTQTYLDQILSITPETKFIFSSSASVYGLPETQLDETHPKNPISPYGESKLMVERILHWYSKSYELDYTSFRYFNACGADEDTQHGQEPDATHIFARLFESINNDGIFSIYGCDYNTKDGTCVRDYIHVQDIADAHILAIEKDYKGAYNIGSGTGYSVLEIQMAVEEYLKKEVVTMIDHRRIGDPDTLVAEVHSLGFKPKRGLTEIIRSLDNWYSSSIYNQQRS